MSKPEFDAQACVQLALQGDWQEIVARCEGSVSLRQRVEAGLWRVRALRALGRGSEADNALESLARAPFEAPLAQVAELAEELVQSSYLELTLEMAARLSTAGARAHASYLGAIVLREREEWVAAEKTLGPLDAEPGPWPNLARIQRAWLLLRQGRGLAARKEIAPLSAEQHIGIQKLLARIQIQTGHFDQAVARLKSVGQRQPLDWEWPGLLGVAKANVPGADPAEIRSLYDTALARQPRQADVLVNRARLFLALGQQDAARRDTDAALTFKPWFDPPVLLWVEGAVARRDFTQGRLLLQEARAQMDTPRRAAAALDLDRMDPAADRAALARVASALAQRFSHVASVQRTAGAALQYAGKPDLAAACYDRALVLVPEDTATRNNLAILYRDRGDMEEAIAAWRSSLEHADDTVLLNYAVALTDRGDRGEARRIVEALLVRSPENAVAHRALADLAHRSGEDTLARHHAQRALELDAANAMSWVTSARVAAREAGEQAAVDLLEQALGAVAQPLPIHQALFRRWRRTLRPADVLERVSLWCANRPQQREYWLMAADAAHDANRFEECERWLREAWHMDPSEGGRALVRFYLSRERDGAARKVAEQLVRDDPERMAHWGTLAEVQYRQGRTADALDTLDTALRREPRRLSLLRQKVGVLLALERFDEAVAEATAAAESEPKPPQLALLMEALGRARMHDRAVVALRHQLLHSPSDRVVRQMYARALERAGDVPAALDEMASLHKDEPGNLPVTEHYVRLLMAMDRFDEAVATLRGLIRKVGHYPDLAVAAAGLLQEQGALDAARSELQQVWQEHPSSLPVAIQMASLERRGGDIEAERRVWQQVMQRFPVRHWIGRITPHILRLDLVQQVETALNGWRLADPESPAPWWAAFAVAKELNRHHVALKLLDKIEKRTGAMPDIHASRADLLQDLWEISDALRGIRAAIDLRPDHLPFRQKLFDILVKAGDFDEIDDLLGRMEKLLGDRRYAHFRNLFFNINCHPTLTSAQLWRFYSDWYERAVKPGLPAVKPHNNQPDPERRLRVAYVSPDLRRHAVAYFSEPLLMAHDRDAFEVFAYAHLEPGQEDAYTARFKSYVHHWIDIAGMSDVELERRIREDGIDILVDLAGHTSNNRLALMMRRPAPLQVSWIWGAGQTTGLPQIDAFMTDSQSVPAEHDGYMAERVVRMARAGLPFKPADDMPEPVTLPSIEAGHITFGVLARPLRTNRRTVAVWAQILHAVPSAILRFDHAPYVEGDVQNRLVRLFAEHGIDASRLEFRNSRPHWLAYHAIDIQLDPFPAGSGTTASESLFMERLVVTLRDRPVMGRITHAQLSAVDLDGICSAGSEAEYVALAVALAQDAERLSKLSSGLRERVKNSWLADYHGLGQEVARIYREMWREWCSTPAGRSREDLHS